MILCRLCTANIDGPVDTITYTQCLNADGLMEADITVTKQAENQFLVIATDTMHRQFEMLLRRNLDPSGEKNVTVTDITSGYTQLNIQGPKSRDLMQVITDTDMSNEKFPFRTAREIATGLARVLVARITYVGELGWELHIPIENLTYVYDLLWQAGQEFGLINAGYRAIESLRLEKGYRLWAADIGPDYTPFEAGLGWAVKLKKDIPFLGRQALLDQTKAPLKRRLACFTVDDKNAFLFGRETIYRKNERVGWITSGGFGYTVGKMIGYGYVRNEAGVSNEYLEAGTYELEVATRRVPAKIHMSALYDPRMERIKA